MEDLRFDEEDESFSQFPDFSSFLSHSNTSADHLLGEEALFSAQYFCTSTCSENSLSLDELGDLSVVDFTSFWTQMEQEDAQRKGKEGDWEDEKALMKMESGTGSVQKVAEMRGRQGVGSTEKKALTFELVSRHFSMPIKQAARELNVGVTVLKKRCRKLGIPRWPHRKVKSLQTLIDNVQELTNMEWTSFLQELGKQTAREDGHLTWIVVEDLMRTKKLIEERPEVMLDERTKGLRQACFKESFKRRRFMESWAMTPGEG